MTVRPHIFDLSLADLCALIAPADMPAYRADQILDWVYRQHVIDPQQMTNLGVGDRKWLAENLRWTSGRVVRHQIATDGVQKLLLEWDHVDGLDAQPDAAQESVGALPLLHGADHQTECVMIPAGEMDSGSEHGRQLRGQARARRTACVSSQVGCPVGCRFCASGLGGLDGNLTSGQIVEQVWRLATLAGVARITNVVFMGMGEPLANFEHVVAAAHRLNAATGMGISARSITISTVGLPAQIRRLAQVGLPVTLAISLHAPDDALRRQLIPWAQYVSIAQILEAGRYYFDQTGREITLEYILLGGVNDRPAHARALLDLARSLRANVNLIRYNPVAGLPFERPTDADVARFQQVLRDKVSVHIRASRGRDIAAACGQLRHEHAELRAT